MIQKTDPKTAEAAEFYKHRINLTIDYIESHLDEKLTLDQLADVAMFSKFHFHRIFKSITNEPLNQYIKRRKMEVACRQIQRDATHSLTQIAFNLGYSSVANFSRDFREFYKLSPSEIRSSAVYPIQRKKRIQPDINVKFVAIKQLSEIRVIYKRISTGYSPDNIQPGFQELFNYSHQNGFFHSYEQIIGMGYDDPDYTPPEKCRYDACVAVEKDTVLPKDSPYNQKTIEAGLYAVFLYEGLAEDIFPAWDQITKEWVIHNKYLPDDKPQIEMYLNSDRYLEGIYKCHLCLPVKRPV